jgi:dihydroorotate dehydrogenase
MERLMLIALRWSYRIVRPLLFLFDSETVHVLFVRFGAGLTKTPGVRWLTEKLASKSIPSLVTTIAGITFPSPIGLAAGFDYEARLPEALPMLGFGFDTVGTITKGAYEGNRYPRLGRLIRSRSLVVNKGFKNLGIEATLEHLKHLHPIVPLGLSIGRTNTKTYTTHAEAIDDIVYSFKQAEGSGAHISYYELNISCPNLSVPIEFYEPERLDELLKAVTDIGLWHPVFIKMPIDKDDETVRAMLDVIVKHPIAGIIIGNLRRERAHPTVIPAESEKYPRGGLSGVPCRDRSDELIRLAYERAGSTLAIIGCGGVFSADDAYHKIRLGASLIQLITGLIFNGPFLPREIALGLEKLLEKDGFANIADAVGVDAHP